MKTLLDRPAQARYNHGGGVGAPVGLTVFKTAGGPLGAVPGGFDSHTPLYSPLGTLILAVFLNRSLSVRLMISFPLF
jgi:hypothetical protein